MEQTIVALSTPVGKSAIAVVRMSGLKSIEIAQKIFSPMPTAPNMLKSGKLKTEFFTEHAMCVYFSAPRSYTGENSVEFHCHGGTAVISAVINECLKLGARIAQNGEFSKRAFINGKQNLSNAEGVIEMIEAETASAAKAGADLLENKLGKRINVIQNELTDLISMAEAALDYPEEDIENLTSIRLKKELTELINQTEEILSTAALGKIAKYGIDVAIVGAPNVGKSSILNALLGTDRAIVSETPGTTRDTLSESIAYKDIKINFVDTAGIRNTSDSVEAEGIRRALSAAEKADVVLYVTDRPEDVSVYESPKPIIKIYNKSDRYSYMPDLKDNELLFSAKYGDTKEIKQLLYKLFGAGEINSSDLLITNARHADCLKKAAESLSEAKLKADGNTLDCITADLRQAWQIFGEITGTAANEDIIDRIYSKFCLGK